MYDLFFRNRRLLLLAIALIVVTGLSSIAILPRLEDPILKQRAALIHTAFPGANAVRVEALVTEPIEDALKEIEEIRIIRSASRDESSTVTMELKDHVHDVDDVWSRVRDKLNDVASGLPPGATIPQFVDLKFTAYSALVSLRWSGAAPLNPAILQRYADQLEQDLRTVPGTDDVDMFGDSAEEILIEVDQQEISARGLTSGDIARALAASDAKTSAGGLRGSRSDLVLQVNSEFESLERIAATPVRILDDETVITLGDIASIRKALREPPETTTLVDGQPGIMLGCFIQPEARIDFWTDDLEMAIDRFRQRLPAAIQVETEFLQAVYVDKRLSSLAFNLALGAMAVTLVILVMMGWRAALIIGAALPLAGLMVLGGLRILSIPLHQMSITGLIIALGLLIDNAIVAVDEMRKQLQNGLSPPQAIQATVRHLAVPLAGSTFTTCLAFAPLALMPGPAGEFVGSIGISVILAVTSSLFLSLTVVPALAGILRNRETGSQPGGLLRTGIGHPVLYRGYRRSLQFLFQRPWLGLVLGLVLPAAGFMAIRWLPEQFFPPSDRNQFQITMQLPAHVSIHETVDLAGAARQTVLEEPAVEHLHWFVGESAPAFFYNMLPVRSALPNYAQAMVEVEPGTDVTDLIRRLQVRLQDRFPQAQIMVRQLEQGPPVDAPIMLRLFGPDLDELKNLGEQVRLIAAGIPDVVTTVSDAESTSARVSLRVHETQAGMTGLTNLEIADQLRTALDGELGGSLVEGTEVLPVRIRLNNRQRGDRNHLDSFELVSASPDGLLDRIPVDAVADWDLVPGDSTIERLNGFRMNEIQVHVRAGVLASDVLAEFEKRLDESGLVRLPAAQEDPLKRQFARDGYSIHFAGESAERNRAVNNLLANAGVLGVLMLAGLVLSFQSFRVAGLIGIVGGLSVGLGLAALWWFGYPFGFMAIVGIMGLVGVAINDSIVVLAALRADPRARKGDPQATADVVFAGTRHILSTTLTTIAGFMPLILAGGGFWPPLAIAIAGGVSGATILALYFVPSAKLFLFGNAWRNPAPDGASRPPAS